MTNNLQDHWTNRPWLYWVVLVSVGVILASFKVDWGEGGVSGWIESRPALAAWVQAVGTIIALAIAIGVPWRIYHVETQDKTQARRLQAEAVALLIQPPLAVLRGEIERAIDPRSAKAFATGSRDFMELAVEVPDVIRKQIDRLWLLGLAGGYTLHLIANLESNKRLVEEAYRLTAKHPGKDVGHFIVNTTNRLKIAQKHVTRAIAEINTLLDAEI